jgi:hypothetical protein
MQLKNGRNIELQKVLGMRNTEYHGTKQKLSTKKKTGYQFYWRAYISAIELLPL